VLSQKQDVLRSQNLNHVERILTNSNKANVCAMLNVSNIVHVAERQYTWRKHAKIRKGGSKFDEGRENNNMHCMIGETIACQVNQDFQYTLKFVKAAKRWDAIANSHFASSFCRANIA
jgi:hypothetical protein